MADLIVKVLDAADPTQGFLSLREAKVRLGLTGGDPAGDELLQIQILDATAVIMRFANRMMAYEEVDETWRGLDAPYVYLTHYPVDPDDIVDVTVGGRSTGYELEEESGKLWIGSYLREAVRIHYSGGYDLPDDTPQPLKYACLVMLRSIQAQASRESVEGIRMIAHRDSRVIFFDPNAGGQSRTAAQTGSTGVPSVDALVSKYMRLWV